MARFSIFSVFMMVVVLVSLPGCGGKNSKNKNRTDAVVMTLPEDVSPSSAVDLAEVLSERRAAFDIGSGSIKLKVTDVVFELDDTLYRNVTAWLRF